MSPREWQSQVSAMDRYEIIRKINAGSMSEAIAFEQKAFSEAESQADYERACETFTPATEAGDSSESAAPLDSDAAHGCQIGSYQGCQMIADGVTSEVYRSGDTALKVIVTYQNLEPHNPQREIKILQRLQPPCIPLLETFRDQEKRLVLAFPYMPYTFNALLEAGAPSPHQLKSIFGDVLRALQSLHSQGIIHRDLKPSAVLLESPDGPAYLSDFGTAWHPDFSSRSEPPDDKILDIGTGPYRAPEVLFGNKSYGPPVDMWALGVMLAEASQDPPTPLFESRAVHEDGNQLGLILSIFKTLGTPNETTWPEAAGFKVNPFQLWTVFPQRPWSAILPDMDPASRDLIASLVRFDGKRADADETLRSLVLITSG